MLRNPDRIPSEPVIECRRNADRISPEYARRMLVSALDAASVDPDLHPDLRRWLRVLANECRNAWQDGPFHIQRKGALETARSGIGWLASQLYKEFTGQERIVEIMGAAAGVEWAAALGAHVFPNSVENYSEEAACNLLSALSSPIDSRQVPIADPRVHKIVHDLLAIDNEVPVVEFAKEFRGGDVARLRALVNELAAWNQEESHLQSAIDRFNNGVRQYEKRPDRLRTMNIVGFVPAATAAVVPMFSMLPPGLQYLPLGVWLLGVLVGRGTETGLKDALVGRLWDHANGLLAQAPARAVLVSRLRKHVDALK